MAVHVFETVAPRYTLTYGWIGRALDAVFVRSRYRKGMMNLLRGLKEHATPEVEV